MDVNVLPSINKVSLLLLYSEEMIHVAVLS